MSRNDQVDQVETELDLFVERVEFADVTDLDVSWAAVSASFALIDIPNWTKPSQGAGGSKAVALPGLLASLPPSVAEGASSLVEAAKELDGLVKPGSSDEIDEEQLCDLQEKTESFCEAFRGLLETLRSDDEDSQRAEGEAN